ncbi:MAG: DUF350 domain-containing protein [Planctomycetota bacterium]
MEWKELLQNFVDCAVFTLFGIVIFAAAFKVVEKVTPFSVRKEIEEDQNTALGVLIGSIIIGLAIIIAAAIHGG